MSAKDRLLVEAPFGASNMTSPPRRSVGVRSFGENAPAPDFTRYVSRGDRARDHKNWVAAYFHYRSALDLAPCAGGYHVQLGHCLKEAGFIDAAYCAYRSALLLGVPSSDVAEHLYFVSERIGHPETFVSIEALSDAVARCDPAVMGQALLDDMRLVAARLGVAGRVGAFEFSDWMRRGLDIDSVQREMLVQFPKAAATRARLTLVDVSRLAFEGFPLRPRVSLDAMGTTIMSSLRAGRARVVRAVKGLFRPSVPLRAPSVEAASWAEAVRAVGHSVPEAFMLLVREGLESVDSPLVTRLVAQPNLMGLKSNTSLHPGGRPVVSVVILNINKPALTALSVLTVLSAGLVVPHEVLVVDNGSTSTNLTALEAARFGFSLHALGVNKLFGEGNNLGAEAAAGAYLLFLNNDAFLVPGALEEMLAAFSRRADCGAAGPVFLYPDWRVQEAGAFVDAYGNARQRGKDEPEFNVDGLRRFEKVDYVSAACLMVRREVFLALGGFSPRYAPAYYEDTDFCFRLLRAGKAVWLARDARCLHVENATTAGLQTPEEARALSFRQRSKFVADWGGYLRGRGGVGQWGFLL